MLRPLIFPLFAKITTYGFIAKKPPSIIVFIAAEYVFNGAARRFDRLYPAFL